MKSVHFLDLDQNIARARIILAPATILSIYLDAATPDLTPWFRLTGGALEIDRYALVVLVAHLLYATALHTVVTLGAAASSFRIIAPVADVGFAIAVATFTEGPTSPSYAFFSFAIIAVACRDGFGATVLVTVASAVAYLALILLSAEGRPHYYSMRPVYLALTGYLIGFLGQQRINFETRVRQLETQAERHAIARALHDGYIQALAAVQLRLSGCLRLLEKGLVESAASEVEALRNGIGREYDEVRSYIRSLVHLGAEPQEHDEGTRTIFAVHADFRVSGPQAEQILRILLEAIRNTMQHARAETAELHAAANDSGVHITIRDDGVGFPAGSAPPWSIASRVNDLGGRIDLAAGERGGAQLTIDLDAA
jgi:signal transduction histidine kinase